jgi:hypothetical protein
LKALSGYAEYFWLLAKNIKPVENRTWSLSRFFDREELPVRIYLHASKTPASKMDIAFIRRRLLPNQLKEFNSVNWKGYRGCIIGEIDIVSEEVVKDGFLLKSGWFFGPYGFVVKNGTLYSNPIPYKGQLQFFEVTLPGQNK